MWSSKEATRNEKKNAKPEMGYCPFEHWLGKTRRQGAQGARARGWALGAGRAGDNARGAAACGRQHNVGAQGHAERSGRASGRASRAAGVRGARGARPARRPGRAANGLCTRCTQPVFGPV